MYTNNGKHIRTIGIRNEPSQSQIYTNNCKYIQTMANIYEQWQIYTNNGKYIQTIANIYEQWQTYTNNGKYIQTMANIYEQLELGTNHRNHKYIQTIANIYKKLQIYTNNCKYIRTTANSNVLIAPCSTADPSIAGAVLLKQAQYQNRKTNNPGLVMPVFSLKMAQKLSYSDQIFFYKVICF